MSAHKETLKSMLLDIIGDRQEQAAVTMHDYFIAKSREVTGLAEAELTMEEVDAILESATEEELDEAVRAGFRETGDSPYKKSDGTNPLQRPKTQEERDRLAAQIKKNRAYNRSEKSKEAFGKGNHFERGHEAVNKGVASGEQQVKGRGWKQHSDNQPSMGGWRSAAVDIDAGRKTPYNPRDGKGR